MDAQNSTIIEDTRNISYYLAFDLVRQIEANLKNNTRHYRTRTGELLTDLGDVVRAILSGDLAGEGTN